jgi:E3 ubiquitin-protein ligase Topors
LDPEYAAWLDEKKRKAEERLERKRARFHREDDRQSHDRPQRVELMPSPPSAALRMEEDVELPAVSSGLSIKGAAKESAMPSKRLTLLERLAKAKAEAASNNSTLPLPEPEPIIPTPVGILHDDSILDPLISPPTVIKGRGKEVVRARIALKMKLENEKQTFRRNANESKAQELRRRLLESKAQRQAQETDATLRELDRIDRAKEVRRRLMVLKMMAAETDAERRARELREKLQARKREMMRV